MKDFAKSIHVGNATIKFYGEIIDLTKKSESDLKEILEELQALHEGSDEQRAIKEELKRRKVGNADVVKDGNVWVVLYAEGTKSKEFNSEEEAKKFAAQVGNSKVGNASVDQAEAREFQQSIMPIKRLIEDAGVAIYSNPKEAISNLQRAKQECDKAISWAKNI